jgi:aerobic carbon-monoxide dehydrogenase medium subunit
VKAAPLTYHRAESVAQAIELAGRYDGRAKLLAGGQSLMPMMNLRMALAEHLIDISGIAGLRNCQYLNEKVFVGAGVTHAMIEDGRVEDPTRGYLRHVAAGIAYRSVRNRGTIGGSLAHADPAADWPAALRALDALAVIEGPAGEREVPLAEFQRGLMETCLGAADVLKGVRVPRLSPKARWSYLKFTRKVGEFPHSIAAVVVDPALGISNAVLGAVGGKPVRFAVEVSKEELEAATGLERSSYELQLHWTMVSRARAELEKKW